MNKYLEFEEEKTITVWEHKMGVRYTVGEIVFTISEFVFEPTNLPLMLNANCLKEIASFLDKLNKEHKEKINEK